MIDSLPGMLLLSNRMGAEWIGNGNFRWSPIANGRGFTEVFFWTWLFNSTECSVFNFKESKGLFLGEEVGVLLWIPERIRLSITLDGSAEIGVRTSARHSGHINRGDPGGSSPFFFFCLASKSSRQDVQNVCWHGRTLWARPRGSRQTEHSKRSERPSIEPSNEALDPEDTAEDDILEHSRGRREWWISRIQF